MDSTVETIFEISGLRDVCVEADKQSVFVEGRVKLANHCPRCGGCYLHRKSINHRILNLPPVAGKTAKLQVLSQKQLCVSCKHSWWPTLPFTSGKERVTSSFVAYALELLRFGTINDVSKHLDISWDVIKSIHKRYLEGKYKEIDVSEVTYVSIDEFAIAKGHKYMTIVLDISTGRIIHAVEGRKSKDIGPFLEELKKKHPGLKLLQSI